MEFRYMFKTAPNVIFAVDNRTIGNNDFSYFATSVYELNKNRNNFNIAGQAQEELLPEGSVARNFYEKWKNLAFETLEKSVLSKIFKDIDALKQEYDYSELFTENTFKNTEYDKAIINIEDASALLDEDYSLDNSLDSRINNIEARPNINDNETIIPNKDNSLEI